MQVGIIGAGSVGVAVGRQLARAGHRVKLSARNPAAVKIAAEGIGAEAVSFVDAAAQDLVLLAVPWPRNAGLARLAARVAWSNPG